ncbi:MAG: hypothetical protein ACLRU3_05885 [Paraclostridium sp.]
MMERDNEIFKTSLELITNRMKEILDLLENTTIVSNKFNNPNKFNGSKLIELENELNSILNNITKIFKKSDLDENRLIRFSMVVYHKVMNIIEYLKSNIKYGVLADYTNIKVLNLADNKMYKVYNYIKALQLCIDKVSI